MSFISNGNGKYYNIKYVKKINIEDCVMTISNTEQTALANPQSSFIQHVYKNYDEVVKIDLSECLRLKEVMKRCKI